MTSHELHEVREAARELLQALASSRTSYVPTARNAPSPAQVAAGKAARVKRAEERLAHLVNPDRPTNEGR